jgi:hypothetical protein
MRANLLVVLPRGAPACSRCAAGPRRLTRARRCWRGSSRRSRSSRARVASAGAHVAVCPRALTACVQPARWPGSRDRPRLPRRRRAGRSGPSAGATAGRRGSTPRVVGSDRAIGPLRLDVRRLATLPDGSRAPSARALRRRNACGDADVTRPRGPSTAQPRTDRGCRPKRGPPASVSARARRLRGRRREHAAIAPPRPRSAASPPAKGLPPPPPEPAHGRLGDDGGGPKRCSRRCPTARTASMSALRDARRARESMRAGSRPRDCRGRRRHARAAFLATPRRHPRRRAFGRRASPARRRGSSAAAFARLARRGARAPGCSEQRRARTRGPSSPRGSRLYLAARGSRLAAHGSRLTAHETAANAEVPALGATRCAPAATCSPATARGASWLGADRLGRSARAPQAGCRRRPWGRSGCDRAGACRTSRTRRSGRRTTRPGLRRNDGVAPRCRPTTQRGRPLTRSPSVRQDRGPGSWPGPAIRWPGR